MRHHLPVPPRGMLRSWSPRAPALARCGSRGHVVACASAGWRVERQRITGLGLAPARFALAPTDACSPGSCITWALMFDVCPPPPRVEAALEALLQAYPLLAGRPAARCELALQPGAGVPFEVAAWDGVSLPALLDTRLGFADAPVAFDKPPRQQLPFLCLPDTGAMDAKKEALVGVRLTRLADGGGVLAVTVSHLIADGQRCVALLSAFAQACRGEALPAGLAHDRSILWPEALAAHPAVASILREAEAEEAAGTAAPSAGIAASRAAGCAPPAASPPPASWSLLPLHVPAASLASLSAALAPLAPGLRLSTHDALAGLVWTLRSALAGTGLPGEACAGRFIVALDLAGNGLPPGVLPDDFTGNAAAALSVAAPEAGGPDDVAAAAPAAVRGAAPRELLALARAAGAVRGAVQAYRSAPRNAVRHLLACGQRGTRAVAPAPGAWRGGEEQPLVGYATSCLRVPLDRLDCGTGAPAALHYSTLPLRSASGLLFASLAPAPRGDGALVLLAASDAHAAQIKAAAGPAAEVLRTAVPGARLLVARP